MKIALDYDGTYTIDPDFWNDFIALAKEYKHEIKCVTMRRYPDEQITIPTIPVTYTNRQAKMAYCKEHNIQIDIWIDDKPGWIFDNAASYED